MKLTSFAVASLLLFGQSCFADMQEDIVYAKRGDREMKLDFLSAGDGEMQPLVICIHGGGWSRGNKRDYHHVMRDIAKHGVAAASIQYRLSPDATWPAHIEDIKAAHRFLVDNAKRFQIDPERIAVTGGSAGGHLSLMLGLEPKEEIEALRVRGIINLFGPTELRDIAKIEHARSIVETFVGGKLEDHADARSDASPVTLVGRTDPPVLTFHGTEDQLVPFEQATILHDALNQAAVPNRLFPMTNTAHGLGSFGDEVVSQLNAFLNVYVKSGTDMPLVAYEDFEHGAARWIPTDKAVWKAESTNGRTFYSLKKNSDYKPKVRSPLNIALLSDVDVSNFVLDVDMRSTNEPYGHQSLCLFFGHQDPSHFYYVHFGRKADAHANSIFLVNDEPRVSIATDRTDGTDWSRGWHRARIKRDAEAGTIEVFMDDMENPVMTANDKTFTQGKIGIGSFDDMGDFDAIRLWGKRVNK
ncbi:MAG: alpha/beta hydrolase [Planctomycetales bacterium]|nr:alpha/beta hydrolase [Planctomycetales bacterium]